LYFGVNLRYQLLDISFTWRQWWWRVLSSLQKNLIFLLRRIIILGGFENVSSVEELRAVRISAAGDIICDLDLSQLLLLL
jgi:hypothetical protein